MLQSAQALCDEEMGELDPAPCASVWAAGRAPATAPLPLFGGTPRMSPPPFAPSTVPVAFARAAGGTQTAHWTPECDMPPALSTFVAHAKRTRSPSPPAERSPPAEAPRAPRAGAKRARAGGLGEVFVKDLTGRSHVVPIAAAAAQGHRVRALVAELTRRPVDRVALLCVGAGGNAVLEDGDEVPAGAALLMVEQVGARRPV